MKTKNANSCNPATRLDRAMNALMVALALCVLGLGACEVQSNAVSIRTGAHTQQA